MIEAGSGLGLATKARQRLARIGVVTQNTFQRNDAARVSLPRAIDHAHAAAADLFQNLIIADSPIGIGHVDLGEHPV